VVRVESRVNDTGTFPPITGFPYMGSYKPPEWHSTEKPDRAHNERGGLILSEDEALSLRERLRAVEVQIDYLRRDLSGMRDDMREVVASVGRLTDLVSAARGARWAFIGLIAFIGAASTYLPTIVRFLMAAAK
jgi:hypothetical protein